MVSRALINGWPLVPGRAVVAGGGVTKLVNPRIGLIGPSTTEQNNYGVSDGNGVRNGWAASGPLAWALAEHRRGSMLLDGQTGAPYFAGDNRGDGGTGFAEYPGQISALAARLSDVPSSGRVVIYEPGRNDLQAGMSVATYKANVLRDIADLRTRGFAYIFLCKIWKKPVAYGGVWAAGGAARLNSDELNLWMDTLVGTDLKLVDFPAFVTNPANADGDPYTNVARAVDNTHLTNLGGRLAGKAVNAALEPYLADRQFPTAPAESLFPELSGSGGSKTGTGVSGNVADGYDVSYSGGASGVVVCSTETINGKNFQRIEASQLSGLAATGANLIMSRTVSVPANKKTGIRLKAKIPATLVPYMLFFTFGVSAGQGVSPNQRAGLMAGVANITAQTVIGGAGANFQGAVKFDGSEDLDLWLEAPSYVLTTGSPASVTLSLNATVGPSANANIFSIAIGEIQTFDWPI